MFMCIIHVIANLHCIKNAAKRDDWIRLNELMLNCLMVGVLVSSGKP